MYKLKRKLQNTHGSGVGKKWQVKKKKKIYVKVRSDIREIIKCDQIVRMQSEIGIELSEIQLFCIINQPEASIRFS